MKNIGFYVVMLGVLMALWMQPGCIPSGPENQNTANTPSTASDKDPANSAPSQPFTAKAEKMEGAAFKNGAVQTTGKSGQSGSINLKMDSSWGKDDVGVKVEKLDNGAGYKFHGSFGLEGTIVQPNPESNQWTLSGEFTFPGPEYQAGEPYYSPLSTPIPTQNGVVMSQQNDIIIITLPIKRSGQSETASAPQKAPVVLQLEGPKNAMFTILLSMS